MKTRQQVIEEFRAAGVTVVQWAEANSFNEHIVYALLKGRVKGYRGEAHRAAVALGLRPGRVIEPKAFKPAAKKRAA